MSLNLGVLSAAVTLYNKDYLNKLKELEGKSDSTFQKIANMAGAYLSFRAITGFAQKSIQTFSDLEEETNKFNVVFQNMGNETSRVLSELTKNFGLSELAAKKMLAGTGDMLTGFGFDRKTALQLSEAAAKLGADLASFSNYAGGASGATTALTKAMLGETESAKMLGIVIRQDSEEFKALVDQAMTTGVRIEALGQTFYASSEQQAKAIAAMNIAYQQSPNAIGDFMRSQDSLANQTRILQNNLEEFYSTIGKDIQESFAGGLSITNDLVKAYIELSPAARGAVNNVTILTGAMLLLGKTGLLVKANLAAGSWIRNATAAYLHLSRATGIAAKSKVLFAAATRTASAAVKSLYASLGPLGVAMIALSAIYVAHQYMMKQYTSELEGAVNLSNQQLEAAQAASAAHKQQADSANNAMARLQELAKYERLSNNESAEAKQLISELAKIYGNLDISIDKTTGRLKISASAFEQLNQAQKKAAKFDAQAERNALMQQTTALENGLHAELGSWFRDSGFNQAATDVAQNLVGLWDWATGADDATKQKHQQQLERGNFTELQNQLSDAQKLSDVEKKITAYKELQNKLMAANNTQAAERLGKIIANLEREIQLNKEISQMQKNGSVNNKKNTAERRKQLQQQSKEQRAAMENLKKYDFDVKFSIADPDEQIRMLQGKIRDIFGKEVSGKYTSLNAFLGTDYHKLSKQELDNVKQIREIQQEILNIKKESAEYAKKETDSYNLMWERFEKTKANRDLDNQIEKLRSEGKETQARAIEKNQLNKAIDKTDELDQKYIDAYNKAIKDKVLSEEERAQLQELKSQLQEALSDEQHWQSRVDKHVMSGKKDEQNAKTIGSWTLAGLASQLRGAGTPEQETAKNTKKSYDMLKEINSNIKANNNTSTGSYK